MRFRTTPQLLACAIYFLLHGASHLTAAVFEVAPGISIWYPPCGLALALLVLLGPRYAPFVFAANVLVATLTSQTLSAWSCLLFPLLITANYTLAAVLARHFTDTILLPGTRKQTLVFVLIILFSPLSAALGGCLLSRIIGPQSQEPFLKAVLQWWVGDVSGLLTVVPVVMVFAPSRLHATKSLCIPAVAYPVKLWVLAFQIVFLLGSLASVFALAALRQYNAFYLCFLPLIWIALTHGLPGATLATLATTMAGLVGMHYLGSSDFLIISFLLFELAAAAVGLGLGAIVTMRNESQRLLAEHKERFERVIAGSQLGLWDWDVPGRHISCNRHWAEMIGQRYEHLDFHYEAWERLIHPADRERVLNTLTSPLFGAASLYEIEYRLRCSDQQWRWFVLRGSVITRNDMGHPLLFSGTHMDITDRKRAEAEARRLLRINEATTDFIITTDISGGIVYANTAFLKMQKVARKEDLSRGSLLELMPAWASLKLREEAMTAALSSGAWTGELALRSPGAKDIPVSMVALGHHDDDENEETSFSFIMRNISEQRLSETARLDQERRLLQFQKLESLGVLAGGIAHDFNNLLTVVLGNASLARFDLPSDSSIHAPLGQIESAAISAAELCQQMLAYAGRSPLMFRDIDCVQLVEDTTPLLEVTLFKHHRLDFQLTRPIPLIQGDAAQLRLAITNLVINASEAIGDREGTISIRVKPRTIGAHEIAEELGHISLIPGRYVVLQIEDTGRGMAPEELAKIFDPFYSTKQSGHGLGLASVLGIVKSHGGEIHVASTPGAGSCFDVFLPALSTASPRVQPSASERATPKGNGFILVADDDAETRTYIVRIFENLGYSTIQASNGLEALEHCRTIGTKLRIAFIDLTMPMMNGEEAFHQLRAIYPSLPVVLMSDSEEKWLLERFVAAKPAAFIAKPIDVRALQTCIDQLLR